jgi:hypothetical protein
LFNQIRVEHQQDPLCRLPGSFYLIGS